MWVIQCVFGLLIWSFAVLAVKIILSQRSSSKKKLRKLQASEPLLATPKHSMGQDKQDSEKREIEGQDETVRKFWGTGPNDAFALSSLSIMIVVHFVTGVLIYRTSKGDIPENIGRLRINGFEVCFRDAVWLGGWAGEFLVNLLITFYSFGRIVNLCLISYSSEEFMDIK
jgi:hypothetical protein